MVQKTVGTGKPGVRGTLFFNHLFTGIILVLFSAWAVYMVYVTGFSTAVLDESEHVYLIQDHMFRNLGAAALFSGLLFLLRKSGWWKSFAARINEDSAFAAAWRRGVLLVVLVAGFCFVLVMKRKPVADQFEICRAASQLSYRNYVSLQPGGYLNRCPQQLGIVLVLSFFAHFAGTYNYLLFQICNVIALVLLYRGMAKLSDAMGGSPLQGLMIEVAGLLFVPGILYTTFVYGTLIGLSCCVNAVVHIFAFSRKQHCRDLVFAVVLIFLAVVLKENYLIFGIGICILLVLLLLQKYNGKLLLCLGIVIGTLFGTTPLVRAVAGAVTGQTIGTGFSTLSWVAMGLQENTSRYDGWYNDSIQTDYENSGNDTDAQAVIEKAIVEQRLQDFKKDPRSGVRFFAGKNASQWAEPDYQGMWVNQVMKSTKPLPYWINQWFEAPGERKVLRVLNVLQFLFVFGTLLEVLCSRRHSLASVFYKVTVLGGFLFHTVWEAKGQYTLPYAMLMIPLGVEGYGSLVQNLMTWKDSSLHHRRCILLAFAALAAGAGLIRISGDNTVVGDVFLRNRDTDSYAAYVARNSWIRLTSGMYDLQTEKEGDYLVEDEDHSGTLTTQPEEGPKVYIGASNSDNSVFLQFSSGRRLTVPNGEGWQWENVIASRAIYRMNQKWMIHASAQDGYVNLIYQSQWALTYDTKTKTISLDEWKDSEEQRWKLIKEG